MLICDNCQQEFNPLCGAWTDHKEHYYCSYGCYCGFLPVKKERPSLILPAQECANCSQSRGAQIFPEYLVHCFKVVPQKLTILLPHDVCSKWVGKGDWVND